MVKWVLTLTVVGALAAAVAWYPIHGRTVLDRWRAAPGPVAFVQRSASELQTALGLTPPTRASPGPKKASRSTGSSAPTGARPARPAAPAHPTEAHSDEDRAALERLLAEQARR